jgi:hypothetical protein
MPIQLTCSCGRKLQAQDEHAGRRVKCPACGAEMTVPKADEDAVQPAEVTEPAKPRRATVPDDEDDDDRPRRRSRREEEDEDDDRPRRSSRRDDDDEDDEDRPRRRRSRRDDDDDEDNYDRRRGAVGTSGKAIAALVLGLLTFCTGLSGIPAVILGIISLVEIGRSRGRLAGKGLAIAGIVTSVIGVFFLVGVWFAYRAVGETSERMKVQNDMRQLVLAMHNHQDQFGHLPDPYPDAKRGPVRSQLSWRVQLLPFLEQDQLYRQFHHNEPWDSPHNKSLLTRMPLVFAHPKHPEATAQGLTYYRVFTGPQTPFPPGRQSRFPVDFPDGSSNTILVIEAGDPVPWTKPDELTYDPNKPLPKLGGHFRSGTIAGMADTMPRVIGPGVSQGTLRAAITASGGEVLGPDW